MFEFIIKRINYFLNIHVGCIKKGRINCLLISAVQILTYYSKNNLWGKEKENKIKVLHMRYEFRALSDPTILIGGEPRPERLNE